MFFLIDQRVVPWKLLLLFFFFNIGFSNYFSLHAQIQKCNTSTFYLQVNAPTGTKIQLGEVETLLSGEFIISGTMTTAGKEEGYLMKMSPMGVMLLQKRFSKPGNIKGFSARVCRDGSIIIGGIQETGNKLFVMMVDPAFSVAWEKTIAFPAAIQEVRVDLFENAEIAIAAQTGNRISCFSFTTTGNLNWSREVDVPGLVELVSFGSMVYTDNAILTNSLIGGKKKAVVIHLTNYGQSLVSANSPGEGNEEYKLLKVRSFTGNRVTTLNVVQTSAGFLLRRENLNTGKAVEVRHDYTLPSPPDWSATGAVENAGDAMGITLPASGRLFFIKQFNAPQTIPEHLMEYSVPTGSRLKSIARGMDEGFLFGLDHESESQIILLKTDSIGSLADCGYKSFTTSYKEVIGFENQDYTATNAALNLPVATGTTSGVDFALQGSFKCNKVYCPEPPIEDTCAHTFMKTYRSSSYKEMWGKYFLLGNNKHVVATGRINRVIQGNYQERTGLKMLDDKGRFLNGISIWDDQQLPSLDFRRLNDKSLLGITSAVVNGTSYFSFIKIRDDLNIEWTKTVQASAFNFSSYLGDIDVHVDEEENIYLSSSRMGYGNIKPGLLVYKMDKNGNGVWLKSYEPAGGIFGKTNLTVTHSSVIILIQNGDGKGNITVRLNKETGAFEAAYQFNLASPSSPNRRIQYDGKETIFYCGDNAGQFCIGSFDTTGRPLKFKYVPEGIMATEAYAVKDEQLYTLFTSYENNTVEQIFIKTDKDLNLEFGKNYNDSLDGEPTGIVVTDQNIYLAGIYYYNYLNNSYTSAFLKKVDDHGDLLNCASETVAPSFVDLPLTVNQINFTSAPASFSPSANRISIEPDMDGPMLDAILCQSPSICKKLNLIADSTVCKEQRLTIKPVRNPGCSSPVTFALDSEMGSLESYTDSTAEFVFRKEGKTWVKGTMDLGCIILRDSVLVTINPPPTSFLPADTTICKYKELLIQPKGSYKEYLWSNHSTSPTLTVAEQGVYSLEVKDANDCIGKDSIVVATKDCMKGFFIPSAFTPNADGKNDVFRPLLFGNVKKLRFTIYNRWGQVVFDTTDPVKGWDGSLSGEPQGSFVFVWTCSYQFEREEEKFEKGHVTVIR